MTKDEAQYYVDKFTELGQECGVEFRSRHNDKTPVSERWGILFVADYEFVSDLGLAGLRLGK